MISPVELLIVSLLRGSLYVLISASLAMLFGIISVASFCHGDFAMLGGYLSYFLLVSLGLNPILALVLTAAVMFLFGCLIEKSLLFPLRKTSGKLWMFYTFVLTLGISQVLENGALAAFGAAFLGIKSLWPGNINLLGTATSLDRFAILGISVGIVVVFWFFLKYTKIGRAIRAVGINEEAASIFGVNVNFIYTLTFGLSALLAGIGGLFYMVLFTTYPLMGVTANLKAWIVVLTAGLGNIKGAIYCSFLLSFAETLAYTFLSAGWQNVISIIIVALILLFKPTGLFGTEVKGIWER